MLIFNYLLFIIKNKDTYFFLVKIFKIYLFSKIKNNLNKYLETHETIILMTTQITLL